MRRIFPKMEREKPGEFPAREDSASARKEAGPGVTGEVEIRKMLGN